MKDVQVLRITVGGETNFNPIFQLYKREQSFEI